MRSGALSGLSWAQSRAQCSARPAGGGRARRASGRRMASSAPTRAGCRSNRRERVRGETRCVPWRRECPRMRERTESGAHVLALEIAGVQPPGGCDMGQQCRRFALWPAGEVILIVSRRSGCVWGSPLDRATGPEDVRRTRAVPAQGSGLESGTACRAHGPPLDLRWRDRTWRAQSDTAGHRGHREGVWYSDSGSVSGVEQVVERRSPLWSPLWSSRERSASVWRWRRRSH